MKKRLICSMTEQDPGKSLLDIAQSHKDQYDRCYECRPAHCKDWYAHNAMAHPAAGQGNAYAKAATRPG
jgi:hypothetical protein